ncbi:hypothetical protein EBZ38_13295 [bacterium]|nr:hypothetical protein [bacterium]
MLPNVVNLIGLYSSILNFDASVALASDLDYLICYNRGRSGASKVKNPSQDKYLNKVRKEIKNNGKNKIH